ncbi:hypothetical protein DCAR_0101583 [Daucus carota subsp. sativus]|uniref:Major facilitator superfamily (MFS) profile domain-containing protein n=2 Tax=Daucus carota subsp. sativus TaxID=79200 RepID=A0AAF0W4X4_DAUCS|nr:PREDICTED: polyol transporter 5-like [Daucus carota subsp. sativus]WOG82419.1 hypothetical protein DCAR_0101583 [Daucus carota subsp. sativus]
MAGDDHDVSGGRKKNKYAFACAILASMTSVLLGYDTGVMSGAAMYIKRDLHFTDVQIEVIVGIINIYSLLGSAAAGKTSDLIGRRYTMVLAGIIFFLGAILMGLATNFVFLMVGRFVAGIGVGYAMMIAPVYTTEVAPASYRGFLTSFPEVFINSGVLLGYVSNYAFAKLPLWLGWRMMLGIGAIPSVALAIGVLYMPESPRWLVLRGRLGDARCVLEKTSDSKEEGRERLLDIQVAAGIPEDCTDDIVPVSDKNSGQGAWKELLISPTPAVRHASITGIGIHFFQQASGIDAVVLYSPRIFEQAGIKGSDQQLLCTVAVGFCKTIFILISTFLLDKIGRRPLMLTSMGGMVIFLLMLAVSLTVINNTDHTVEWAVALAVIGVLGFVSIFSSGMGPIAWVYSSEVFPMRLRALGCSIGVAVNRGVSGVIGMTFISIYKAMTIGGTFFMFAGIAAIGWLFMFTLFPETHGRKLEEIEQLFGTYFHWRSTLRELKQKEARALEAQDA